MVKACGHNSSYDKPSKQLLKTNTKVGSTVFILEAHQNVCGICTTEYTTKFVWYREGSERLRADQDSVTSGVMRAHGEYAVIGDEQRGPCGSRLADMSLEQFRNTFQKYLEELKSEFVM